MNQAPALLAVEQRGKVDTHIPPRPKQNITLLDPLQGIWVLVAPWDIERSAGFHQLYFLSQAVESTCNQVVSKRYETPAEWIGLQPVAFPDQSQWMRQLLRQEWLRRKSPTWWPLRFSRTGFDKHRESRSYTCSESTLEKFRPKDKQRNLRSTWDEAQGSDGVDFKAGEPGRPVKTGLLGHMCGDVPLLYAACVAWCSCPQRRREP